MSTGNMEEELRALNERVQQLQADNDRLRQGAGGQPAGPGPVSVEGSSNSSSGGSSSMTSGRFLYIPRERKAPRFSGNSAQDSLGIEDWVEEIKQCLSVRPMTETEQALFVYDLLDGEAKNEVKFRPVAERNKSGDIFSILKENFGCSQSYIEAQKSFFQRRQRDGESLREFSHALMALLEVVKRKDPRGVTNPDHLIRDQFVEGVKDNMLRRELKCLVRLDSTKTFLNIRSEALRWTEEGERPSQARARAYSCDTHVQAMDEHNVETNAIVVKPKDDLADLKECLRRQQAQLDTILKHLGPGHTPVAPESQTTYRSKRYRFDADGRPICLRCNSAGHIARFCSNEGGGQLRPQGRRDSVDQSRMEVGATTQTRSGN